MTANDRQVGGSHYKTGYEHWDLVIRTRVGYLEGVATKYLARCYTAGKLVQDLEKSKHYVEKLKENLWLVSTATRAPHPIISEEVIRFCGVNKIEGSHRHALHLILSWSSNRDLDLALGSINVLLSSARAVPLSDSNKHADRL